MARPVRTLPRWPNHPWFVTIVGGLIVTIIGIIATVYIFGPGPTNTGTTIGGTAPAPSPKTKIEIKTYPFRLPGVYPGDGFLTELERELIMKNITENKMNKAEAEIESYKFMGSMYEIKILKNIFNAANASTYNSITIENKGTADDKNVVLFIDGIRVVASIENNPNIEREKDLIKIKLMRPGDKIYLRVWTNESFSLEESKRFRASSDAGIISVSVH